AIYYRIKKGKELIDVRYYTSSAQLSAEELANHVRSHWAVENQLHWVLDVSFREDNCPISRGHTAENFRTFRHVGLNQLKRESTLKASVRRKQRRAAMDTEYLDKVIDQGLSVNITFTFSPCSTALLHNQTRKM
ncbi:hypothetical protein CWC18_19240, partial [Pseudoalteromonas aurantia]|uniref:ISAs1 family transposase n=1 Tax=Pseudoalteromonas aurantia TaxID=43654 RepID=UPI00110BCDD5